MTDETSQTHATQSAPPPAEETPKPASKRKAAAKAAPAPDAGPDAPKQDARRMAFTQALIGFKEGEEEGKDKTVEYGQKFLVGCAAIVVLLAIVYS